MWCSGSEALEPQAHSIRGTHIPARLCVHKGIQSIEGLLWESLSFVSVALCYFVCF